MIDVDHINDDGKHEVGGQKRRNIALYRRVLKGTQARPVQLLCCNCNQSKRRNAADLDLRIAICEHDLERARSEMCA